MVKNFGGNKSKKQGRKFISSNQAQRKLRLKDEKEDGEMYACVKKLFGNGRCLILCIDGIERNCVIRNKFRGRSKRDNTLIVGSHILAGVRLWETKTEKKEQDCDLLEVYNDNEVRELKDKVTVNWKIFNEITSGVHKNNNNDNDDDLGFVLGGHNIDEELQDEINYEKNKSNIESSTTTIAFDDDEEFNIEDI